MNSSGLKNLTCQNRDCQQEVTIGNLQLAACLYGIFFLVRADKGFVGFTCPRCLETSLYQKNCQSLLDIKNQLSWIDVCNKGIRENGNASTKPVLSFESDLRYYSPFALPDEILIDFDIMRYGAANLSYKDHFFEQLAADINDAMPEAQYRFCSFIQDDQNPAGLFSAVYWFREEDIRPLLKLEREKGLRIFPRYHYYTDLVHKIDPLLRAHYFMGKKFEKARADHEKDRINALETLKSFERKKNLNLETLVEEIALNDPDDVIKTIDKQQDRIAGDPELSGEFLDVLISDPCPLGNPAGNGYCDHLWTTINPFYCKKLPETFISRIEPEDNGHIAGKMRAHHAEMVAHIQENTENPYIWKFLKKNLTAFLEGYEKLLKFNQFSYAGIWRLKESYLKNLHEAVKTG